MKSINQEAYWNAFGNLHFSLRELAPGFNFMKADSDTANRIILNETKKQCDNEKAFIIRPQDPFHDQR